MLKTHEFEVRVRYQETDGQGRVHHANYLTYLEAARTELLRDNGTPYQELEQAGTMLVIAEASCRYLGAAYYDDRLIVVTTVERTKGARIFLSYTITRAETDEPIFTGSTTLACVNLDGSVQRLPEVLRIDLDS